MKTDGYEWLEGTAFWDSPTLQVSSTKENKAAYEEFVDGKNKQRKGV
jgi:3D-(3,5/4)-trihydroxycyclohexane-1,2-dione acylhydrolase (decyclizing)